MSGTSQRARLARTLKEVRGDIGRVCWIWPARARERWRGSAIKLVHQSTHSVTFPSEYTLGYLLSRRRGVKVGSFQGSMANRLRSVALVISF
eukprot:1192088-Prorocentrum_minimum.AAC.1